MKWNRPDNYVVSVDVKLVKHLYIRLVSIVYKPWDIYLKLFVLLLLTEEVRIPGASESSLCPTLERSLSLFMWGCVAGL